MRTSAGPPGPRTSSRVRVLLVAGRGEARDDLRHTLGRDAALIVVGEVPDARAAAGPGRAWGADVVVVELGTSSSAAAALDAARALVAARPGVRVVVVSANVDAGFAIDLLRVGVVGFVARFAAQAELATAVRAVADERVYFSPPVVARLARGDGAATPGLSPPDGARALSSREVDVLRLVADGLSLKEIATRLTLGVKTIETHRRRLSRKVGAESVAALIKFAIRAGVATAG